MSDKEINHYSPSKQPAKGGFCQFLYNSESGQVLGRTGISWAKITAFYIAFFFGLACFFVLCYSIFYFSVLDTNKPRWIGEDGLIGGNPGIGFRPSPDQDEFDGSTLIWINNSDTESVYFTQLQYFIDGNETLKMEGYRNKTGIGLNCTYDDSTKQANETAYCFVNVTSKEDNTPFGCTDKNKYGYVANPAGFGRQKVAQPCVAIKLNKIFGWIPIPYNDSTLEKAVKREIPKNLLDRIQKLNGQQSVTESESKRKNTVWVICEGENPGDKEAIGDLQYFSPDNKRLDPMGGIPNYYFPYWKQTGYETPFIFVKFVSPRTNTLIQVECKGWAENMEADRQMRLGSVHFELMIDDNPPKKNKNTQ